MSSTSIDGLLKVLASMPTSAPGAAAASLGEATFGEVMKKYEGEIEKTTYDKDGVVGDDKGDVDAAIATVTTGLEAENVTVKVVGGPYGKVREFTTTSTDSTLTAAVNFLNERPSVSNPSLRKAMKKAAGHGSSDDRTDELPSMEGGASFLGEFEAVKNTHDFEKQTIEMIGGGSKWAPALAPEATSRSKTFRQLLNRLVQRLAANGKALNDSDKDALGTAIDSLEEKEREASVKLAYLKKYSDLVQTHKNTSDEAIKKALKEDTVEDFVAKYMHTLKRVERKSSKLWGALGALVIQAGPWIVM